MALPKHARKIAIAASVVAVIIGGFFLFGGTRLFASKTREPIDAVPTDAFLVATVDLAELRKSPIYDVVLGGSKNSGVLDSRELGMAKLADACGFDPLSRVDKLAVAVPEDGDKGELGVAARGTLTSDELTRCTSALADKRGGKVDAKDIGSFTVVEDASSEGPVRPRLAFGKGLLVAGRGAWFDAMLATAEGKRKGVRDSAVHAEMRTSLTSKNGWNAPTLVVTALLPRSLRDRLKNEMSPEASNPSVMAGVLGVSTLGLAVHAGPSGQNLDAAIELVCDNEEACAAVEKLILKKKFDWSKELMLRMVGLGGALDSIEIKREGLRIRVTAGAPADTLASTIERVLRHRERRPERPVPAPKPSADETVRPP